MRKLLLRISGIQISAGKAQQVTRVSKVPKSNAAREVARFSIRGQQRKRPQRGSRGSSRRGEKLQATKIKNWKSAAEVGQARVKQLMHTGYVSAANGSSSVSLAPIVCFAFLFPSYIRLLIIDSSGPSCRFCRLRIDF